MTVQRSQAGRSGPTDHAGPAGRDVAPHRTSPVNLDAAISAALAVVDANMETFGLLYPGDTTLEGRYANRPALGVSPEGGNYGWTTSFWPGVLWLAYELTGEDRYRELASAHVASFAARIEDEVDLNTHDLGFLYTLACVPAWRHDGDERARTTALAAAEHLAGRFLEPAGIVQAWGDLVNDPEQRGRTIIDSLMNMPLLHWAGDQTGQARFGAMARRHVTQLARHIVRPDDTTFHTFYWDVETGEPSHGRTQQGYADDSCWARGQAWGVYGFAINHRYTGDPEHLEAALRCARYFVSHLPADGVAYWDLVFGDGDGSGQPRDSSAAAIAACGLIELAGLVQEADESAAFLATARRIVDSLATSYAGGEGEGSNALLLHGVYDWQTSNGVDEGNLWGDYFYLEALARLRRPELVPSW